METSPPTAHPRGLPTRLLLVEDVERLLGRSRDWIYDEVEAGRLPARRVGRLLRFHPDDLVEWLDGRRTVRPGSGAPDRVAHRDLGAIEARGRATPEAE